MPIVKYIIFFIFKKTLNENLTILLKQLWNRFNKKRKKQLGLLLIITLISALAEVMTLGAVFPFIGVITNPDKVFEYPLDRKTPLKYLNIESKRDLVLFITCSFAGLALAAGLIRITVLWVTTRLAFASGAELSIESYRRALFQPYKVHIYRNSSEVISAILVKINSTINWVVLPILMSVSAILVLIYLW